MFAGMRDMVRFQGRVRRLPALYAISLWAAGIIEFVGTLVLLFVYSAIAKVGAGTANQDAPLRGAWLRAVWWRCQ